MLNFYDNSISQLYICRHGVNDLKLEFTIEMVLACPTASLHAMSAAVFHTVALHFPSLASAFLMALKTHSSYVCCCEKGKRIKKKLEIQSMELKDFISELHKQPSGKFKKLINAIMVNARKLLIKFNDFKKLNFY